MRHWVLKPEPKIAGSSLGSGYFTGMSTSSLSCSGDEQPEDLRLEKNSNAEMMDHQSNCLVKEYSESFESKICMVILKV